ncbi:hypothetical protein D9757_012678 [Collybiopsis confluens]|uniref:Uncharacterized protein n=1 Tax=Collybiopsis confluens TaxID=2823264 RepID=A0A8H5LIR4_9AGAR|nr:hypothetical protein D9757_012678 [Collybiopsis confluens]
MPYVQFSPLPPLQRPSLSMLSSPLHVPPISWERNWLSTRILHPLLCSSLPVNVVIPSPCSIHILGTKLAVYMNPPFAPPQQPSQ